MKTALERLREISADLNRRFPCRKDEIMGTMLCLLTGELKIDIGTRGDGKTALARALNDYFTDASFFMAPMSKSTTVEDLFGGPDLVALQNNEFRRATKGRAAATHIVFFDEMFKGSEAVAQSLLNPLSERIFEGVEMPLIIATCASNELPYEIRGQKDGKVLPPRPGEDSLMPLMDRFILKYVVQTIEPGTPEWKQVVHQRVNRTIGTDARISVEEIAPLRQAIWSVKLSEAVEDKVDELAINLKSGVGPSNRKVDVSVRTFGKVGTLLRAYAAWLGDTEVSKKHFEVLEHALWNTPDQREVVREAIINIGSVVERDCASTVRSVLDLVVALESNRLSLKDGKLEQSPTEVAPALRIGCHEAVIKRIDSEVFELQSGLPPQMDADDYACLQVALTTMRDTRAVVLRNMTMRVTAAPGRILR
jgi:MoxR-like ATPase